MIALAAAAELDYVSLPDAIGFIILALGGALRTRAGARNGLFPSRGATE